MARKIRGAKYYGKFQTQVKKEMFLSSGKHLPHIWELNRALGVSNEGEGVPLAADMAAKVQKNR